VKFARVSSRFTTKRWHPVLKRWRSHKGVDYAAPTGTPIKATGAGKVIFRGWKGGYGKVVIIQHGSKYTTLYAHMSRFASKAKSGSRVKQGQIVGYVGQTGLASGPHLHYEFRVNGVHRNPLTVKLPKSVPLPKAKLAQFRTASSQLLAQLDRLAPPTVVAQADTAER
jgi:murein DD-endopeptidase MepM/ murein hydrolase activator NlpD